MNASTRNTTRHASGNASAVLLCGLLVTLGCSSEDDPDELAGFGDTEDLEALEARSGSGGGGKGKCPHHDKTPPKVIPKPPIELWPPNHKYHVITIDDCIKQVIDCDPHWTAKFRWGSSDEPENATGDGNTWNDINFISEDEVELRAERQGHGDGRVYKLEYVVMDSKHNKTTGICKVTVPHDQSGAPAVDSGTAYTVNNPYW